MTTLPPPGPASVRHLPVNLFAAVMGLSGLALAWRVAHALFGAPALVGEAIAALAVGVFVLLATAYLAKLVRHPGVVLAEYRHPVSGNFFGTIAISVLLLSAVAQPYSDAAAGALWTAGALAAFAQGFVIVSRLLGGQVDASHALPAWLISGVATLDIAVTGGGVTLPWAAETSLAAGAVGSVLALAMFVLIVGRLVHREPLAPAMRPSLMILVAPFAVGFLAYANIAGHLDRFAGLLFWFGVFIFLVAATQVFRRGVPFTVAWWAISFPLAALANAGLRWSHFAGGTAASALALAALVALTAGLGVLAVLTVRIALNGQLLGGSPALVTPSRLGTARA